MKKVYIEPVVKNVALPEPIMQETPYSAWDPMGKENDEVVEDDEEPTSLVEKEAQPIAFSNKYLKKVWD
jgi:hypothetical protein